MTSCVLALCPVKRYFMYCSMYDTGDPHTLKFFHKGLPWLYCLTQAKWTSIQKKRSSHGSQLCIATGFYLAPLLGTNMMYFRGIDFSEGPEAALLRTQPPLGRHWAQYSCSLPTESLAICYFPHTTTSALFF